MMDPFQNNMATQFGRFRILFRKSFIENVYINILKNIFLCNSFYLIIFLKHLRCVFTNAYGVRICSACGGNSRRYFGKTMCLHTKDTSTGQPTAGRSKLPSAAGVFRKMYSYYEAYTYMCHCLSNNFAHNKPEPAHIMSIYKLFLSAFQYFLTRFTCISFRK